MIIILTFKHHMYGKKAKVYLREVVSNILLYIIIAYINYFTYLRSGFNIFKISV